MIILHEHSKPVSRMILRRHANEFTTTRKKTVTSEETVFTNKEYCCTPTMTRPSLQMPRSASAHFFGQLGPATRGPARQEYALAASAESISLRNLQSHFCISRSGLRPMCRGSTLHSSADTLWTEPRPVRFPCEPRQELKHFAMNRSHPSPE